MDITKEWDTIAAISTPLGEGAISIVRLSGDKAFGILAKVFRMKQKKVNDLKSHTIHYGYIFDNEEELDEVMVSVMRAPRTFTREDIVEINCHGGIYVTNQILQLLLKKGARLAEPGEFSKRAFLNGRIDLSQAEATMDLIRAKTDASKKLAISQLDGKLSQYIRELRQEILETLAQVEVNIDYPEYDDVEELTSKLLAVQAENTKEKIEQLLTYAQQGKILREGLPAAIIGRPNVGKSSLLNYLLREDRAIVTDIAGTTRDVIEEFVNIQGIPLRLIDTAGIRETEDVVEQIGVEKSKAAIKEADLVLFMLNNNEQMSKEDELLFELVKDKEYIVLINKCDLSPKLDEDEINTKFGKNNICRISIKKDEGIDRLEKQINQLFFTADFAEKDGTYISNVRHIHLLQEAADALNEVLDGIRARMPVDLVQIDMTKCWDLLGEILGENIQDELITQLFSQFCLGK